MPCLEGRRGVCGDLLGVGDHLEDCPAQLGERAPLRLVQGGKVRVDRAILDELTERDGQLFELCARLATKHGMGSTRQAVSQHIDALEAAGLVSTHRQGRYKFHHLDTTPLRQITDRWPISGRKEKR